MSPRKRPRRPTSSPCSAGPSPGPPPNPGAWLTTTAYNRAIDRIRRESTRDSKQAQAAMINEPVDDPFVEPPSSVVDDRLRLMFTCCHPALATGSQVALTLRLLGGLTHRRDRQRLPGRRGGDGQATDPVQAEDQGGPDPLPGPARCRIAEPAARRPGHPVSGLQRGLSAVDHLFAQRDGRRSNRCGCWRRRGRPNERAPGRAVQRGDPVDADPGRPDAGRTRGTRTAGPDAAHRGPPAQPVRGRRPRHPPGPGPIPVGSPS